MKLTSARLLLALFLAAALSLGTRLLWVAATTETGFETLALSWYNAALGPIGLEREPIGDRDPAQQADIWLREVDRVLAAHPDNAQIAMGAAWILDNPGGGFLQKHVELDMTFAPSIIADFYHEAIPQASDRFEAKCAARCLELAARATELQPQNADWWRMRALLLFPSDFFYYDEPSPPRRADWLATLDECARHDPDNALYDYLAALRLWTISAERDFDANGDWFVEVQDADRFAEGIARFERGQRKRYLAPGRTPLPAVAKFLGHAGQFRREEGDMAFERQAFFRGQGLPIDLRRWQEARAGTREKEGDPHGALAAWRQQRHMHRQLMTGDDPYALRHSAVILITAHADVLCLQQLASKHPALTSTDELAALQTERENLLADVRLATQASKQAGSVVRKRHPLDTITPALLTTAAEKLTMLLLIVAALGCGLARWVFKAQQPAPLGVCRHLLACSLGWGLTVFLLGICPADVLGRNIQATVVACGTCLIAMGMLGVLFRALAARCHAWAQRPATLPIVCIIVLLTVWQATVAGTCSIVAAAAGPDPSWYSQGYAEPFSGWQQPPSLPPAMLRLALLPTAVLAALLFVVWVLFLVQHKRRTGRFLKAHFVALGLMALSVVLVLGAFTLAPNYLGGHCWPPERAWEGFQPGLLNIAVMARQRPWHWAALEWAAHAGLFVSPGLSLLLVTMWYWHRRKRMHRQTAPAGTTSSRRQGLGGLFHCLGRSALGMAACCLLIHLVVAPGMLRIIENDYQAKMAYVRDPQVYWEKVRQAEAAIRSDPTAMKEIRDEVAEQLRWEAEQDQPADEELEVDS